MSAETPSTLLEAAVWYCEHGFGIFPLHARSKKPATKNGLNDWFDDPESARAYWSRFPDSNIGIVCGTPSHGLLVLDFDVDEESGEDGTYTLGEWEHSHGELLPTAVAITGRGGMHYLYRTDRTNIRPSVNKELGVDVRAEGSYIVAPPSIHPTGSAYAWAEGSAPWESEVAQADGNVYDLLDHVQRNGGQSEDRPLPAAFNLPEKIKKGERDDTLYKYGCSLRTRGYRDDAILAMLMMANSERCDVPLPDRDVKRIAKSVCKKGPGLDGQGTFLGEEAGMGAPGGYRVGEGETDPLPPFRTPRGRIEPNRLARIILSRNHARHIDGALAVWDIERKRWRFGREAVEAIAIGYADDIRINERNEVYGYLRAKAPHVTSDSERFDRGWYVQFSNCTYDVVAGVEVDPVFTMLITATVPVELDLDAPYGDADRFLESLAGGDEDTEQVLKEIIGACMCCRRVVPQAPMLIGRAPNGGTAANGKSTFINVLRTLLGSENVSSLDIATLGQRFQAGRLVGRLANLGDDIPDGFLKGDELSLFKKLVTGDEIYTDVKNSQGFEFRPNATMVFSMNAMPRLADSTEGVFRRLAFVPFRAHFAPGEPGFNPHMAEDMCRPENLKRLALLGLQELPSLIRRGALTQIPDMVAEVESIRIDNDIVRRWMFEELIDDTDLDGRWADDVYKDFKRWADDAGERFAVSQTTFTKKILATLATLEVYVTRNRDAHKQARKFRKKG